MESGPELSLRYSEMPSNVEGPLLEAVGWGGSRPEVDAETAPDNGVVGRTGWVLVAAFSGGGRAARRAFFRAARSSGLMLKQVVVQRLCPMFAVWRNKKVG